MSKCLGDDSKIETRKSQKSKSDIHINYSGQISGGSFCDNWRQFCCRFFPSPLVGKRFNRSLVRTGVWRGFWNCPRTLKTAEISWKSWKRTLLFLRQTWYAPNPGWKEIWSRRVLDFCRLELADGISAWSPQGVWSEDCARPGNQGSIPCQSGWQPKRTWPEQPKGPNRTKNTMATQNVVNYHPVASSQKQLQAKINKDPGI